MHSAGITLFTDHCDAPPPVAAHVHPDCHGVLSVEVKHREGDSDVRVGFYGQPDSVLDVLDRLAAAAREAIGAHQSGRLTDSEVAAGAAGVAQAREALDTGAVA